MTTVASQVSFSQLCGLLEKIQKTQGNEKKKLVLSDFIEKWRDFDQKLHQATNDSTDSFYPAMRLLLPHLEKERMAYGIKEHMFAKLLIEVLCLGKDSPDANRLLNFKAPKNARGGGDIGDFASVAFFVLKDRCPSKGSLTIEEVNRDLDAISLGNANKDKNNVKKHIMHLLTNLNATEQKWLIRMIVKEMKIGISQTTILNVYHPDAEDFYNVNNNLEKVCCMLKDPKTRSHEIDITLFSPFIPMLGERASPDQVQHLMDNKQYFIETKFDGERFLLHKDGDVYKYFSRSGNDYSHVFGPNPYEGTLTPYIANCFKSNVKRCILDGEMLGFHAESKTYGTKGEQFDIKSKDCLERTGYQPSLQVFDILLLNDKVLSNTILKDRLPLIEDVFHPVNGRITRSDYVLASTNQDCADALNKAIDNKEEGIMVKAADSVYRPSKRKAGWLKIKPEYVGGLMDELDILIVGGYYGVGHRGGIMSHFLCAVAVPPGESQDKATVFYSFCKVGSGYSKKQLRDLLEKLGPHWRDYDKKRPPAHLELAAGFKERPDRWIPPDKSFIMQVKAAEIIESDKYRTGCTLRFPRVDLIRDDKTWYECMTVNDLEDLRKKSGGKLAGSKYELDESNEEPSKKKRKIVNRAIKPTLMQHFKGADLSNVIKLSEVFVGKEFCVMNGPPSYPKQDLERKIAEYGGSVVQNPDTSTLCVVVDKTNVRVSNLIKQNKHNIVKAEWLCRVLDSGDWIPWSPRDMIHTTCVTKQAFEKDFDTFGDSYTCDVSEDQLRDIFDRMPKVESISGDLIAGIEDEYFPDESPYGLFRTCRVYVDKTLALGDPSTRIPNSPLELVELELRFFGAALVDHLEDSVSHVLVDEKDLTRLTELKSERQKRRKKFHIISERWMRACLEEGDLISDRTYEISESNL